MKKRGFKSFCLSQGRVKSISLKPLQLSHAKLFPREVSVKLRVMLHIPFSLQLCWCQQLIASNPLRGNLAASLLIEMRHACVLVGGARDYGRGSGGLR